MPLRTLLCAVFTVWSSWSQAQEGGVFRCGQVWTNQPHQYPEQRCERVDIAGFTVRETQVYGQLDRANVQNGQKSAGRTTVPSNMNGATAATSERSKAARALLEQELAKVQAQRQKAVLLLKTAPPAERTLQREKLQRLQEDEASLQREIQRLP